MDDLIVGIDLGTTNSWIGAMDSGFPVLLADENGGVAMAGRDIVDPYKD
jgi:molecular chaperone DnaK (HSP70)